MIHRHLPFARFVLATFASLLACGPVMAEPAAEQKPAEVRWRKVVVNDKSPFEACGVADFNGDGKLDIFCGDSWYEGPNWARHKVRTVAPGDPKRHYYDDFADSPLDCNGDGRPDIVTCTYFSARLSWVENPGGDAVAPWTEHVIDTPGNMETGELVDINGDGRPDFLPNIMRGTVAWYELMQQKPKVVWEKRALGPEGVGHGVGVGDINADGRLDVITPKGWYEQPAEAKTQRWIFHKDFSLGAAGIFILGRDVDGDKKTDIVWGMGHNYGVRWLQQTAAADGSRTWARHDIDTSFSQAHTQLWADLDGDGTPELVTGKRVYAHDSEPGALDKPCVYYFRFDKGASGGQGSWSRHTIFEGEPAASSVAKEKNRDAMRDFAPGSAGTGLQMTAVDIDGDGDLDLVCPGKSGLYLFVNQRK